MNEFRDNRDERREERRAERERRRNEFWEGKWDHQPGRGNVWTGVLLLLIGFGIFLRISMPEFNWLLSWPTLLIVIGLLIGVRKGFRDGGWFIPIIIGGFFLLNNEKILPDESRKYMWPALLVLIGLVFIFRPRNKSWQRCQQKKNGDLSAGATNTSTEQNFSQDDFIDATSIFGGTQKVILSKNFRGGELVNIFGGAEIDLTQADVNGTAELDVTAIFGGATLVVPSNWVVKSEAVCIFGGIHDKRKFGTYNDSNNKSLILKGTVIFGGIEIKSF